MSTNDGWLSILADSLTSVPEGDTTIALIDPEGLAVVAATAGASPGVLDAAQQMVVQEIGPDIRSAYAGRVDDSWERSMQTDHGQVDAAAALVWNATRDQAAVIMSAALADLAQHEQFEPVPVSASTVVQSVYDRDMRCIISDPRLRNVGFDPADYLGSHPFVTTHPSDVVRVSALVNLVVSGEALEVEYVTRAAGPFGRWYNHHVTFRALHGAGPCFLGLYRALGARRTRIDVAALTDREIEVVGDFFSGLSIPEIARRYAVSEKTVRNQMSGVYRLLGVGSASEMLTSYDPPDRVLARQLGVRPVRLDSADAAEE